MYRSGIDIRYDGGLSLALALWSRSAVLLDLNRGNDALADIQFAIDNGLDDVKKHHEYYVRMAKANASKLHYATKFIINEWTDNVARERIASFFFCN